MLTTLRIKNLALVDDLTLELAPGFNAITGETGAGKSIIIGALNLLLGDRADRTLLRAGAESCTVEAVFDIRKLRPPLAGFLEDNGLEPCEDGQLVLKRAFSSAGANRQFVNGSPTPLATLAALGEWLVDMHGPHDHQSLLHPAQQLDILDAFGKLESQREAFAALVRRRAELSAEKAALIVDERTYAQRLDLLRHQVAEIQAARLRPGEEEELEAAHRRAHNAARLAELSQGALDLLGEGEAALLTQWGALGRLLHELKRLDPGAASLADAQEQASEILGDLQRGLSQYADKLELDPAQLAELDERMDLLQSLKRKYGAAIEDILAFGETAARELRSLEQRDAELERLQAELAQVDASLAKAGRELTRRREKVIPGLAKGVAKELAELGFKRSHFAVALRPADIRDGAPPASGLDAVEFQFAPNPGEPVRPLRAIASSGEMARVMLALKTVLAAEDQIPVLVFDEVDANVGGETAGAVGEKIARIARHRQVLCITHLASVAAAAATHYAVAKEVRAGRTLSRIERLERPARVEELARMLGGGKAAQQHAEALLPAR